MKFFNPIKKSRMAKFLLSRQAPVRLIAVLLLSLALPAAAETPPPLPKDLQPLPEPPPPPPGLQPDQAMEPQVTIVKRGEDVVEEYRIANKLFMMKVTPPHGKPYFLIDYRGDGQFTRQDNLDSGVRVPQWVLMEF